MTPEQVQDLVSKLRDRYRTADEFARLIAEYRSSVVIPAHNQLRYAGHHLLSALNDNGVAADENALREAISHCERAVYDAGAAGIISAVEAIGEFFKDYEDIAVREVVSESADIKKRASTALDLLAHMRSEDSPSESVESFMEVFGKLRESHELLELNRDDLNAKVGIQIRSRRRFLVTIAVTLLGIAVAVAIAVLG